MNKTIKKRMNLKDFVFYFFIFLFPILPQYIYLFWGINILNFSSLIFIVFVLIFGIANPKRFHTFSFLLLFLIASSLRILLDGDLTHFVSYAMNYILVPFIVISYVDSKTKLDRAINSIILGGFVLGLFGLAEEFFKTNFFQMFANGEDASFYYEIRYGLLRIMTTFGQPISYGIYQCFILGLLFYKFEKQRRMSLLLFIVYLISILNIVFTVSRLPIIIMITLHIIFIYKHFYKNKDLVTVVLIAITFFGVLLVSQIQFNFMDDLISTFKSLLNQDSIDTTSGVIGIGNRIDLYYWVGQSMNGNWLFGNGNKQFSYEVYSWFTKTSIENQYLNILFTNGITGLVLLVLSYFEILSYLLFAIKKDSKTRNNCFAFVSFVVLILYFIGEFGIQETDMSRMYLIFVSLVACYCLPKKRPMYLFKNHPYKLCSNN